MVVLFEKIFSLFMILNPEIDLTRESNSNAMQSDFSVFASE